MCSSDLFPSHDIGGFAVNSLYDYFGLPTVGQVSAGKSVTHSALPFRAYNLIFNEWFRDENLVTSFMVDTGDGPDPSSYYSILNRGKRHDYFTSCLPWPQKGPSVNLPLGTQAPVKIVAGSAGGRQCVCQLYDRRTSKMNQMTGLFIGGRYVLFPSHDI